MFKVSGFWDEWTLGIRPSRRIRLLRIAAMHAGAMQLAGMRRGASQRCRTARSPERIENQESSPTKGDIA
ncbi:hypothetical protein [Variovorax rhizosphaerae]|uniref:Uncharacterized protein n=1 Tax=Variovorax rhizosphaerae TaxID=1836200 RepID=A0ABU8WNR9_9BURK